MVVILTPIVLMVVGIPGYIQIKNDRKELLFRGKKRTPENQRTKQLQSLCITMATLRENPGLKS